MFALRRFVLCSLLLSALGNIPAYCELSRVVVGGEISIRGNFWRHSFNSGNFPTLVRYERRWAPDALVGRPIGSWLGGQSILSHFDWDERGADYRVVEQRTRLHFRGDFTGDIWAYVELDSYDVWGEDFRSNYLTGVDGRSGSVDDVEVYQGYVAADSVFGLPVDVRIGRQELVLGDGWLVGDNSGFPESPGLSFDGIRAMYRGERVQAEVFWTKLAEGSPVEQDGDADFLGAVISFVGVDWLALDGYWLWLRDSAALHDTQDVFWAGWVEHLLGLDDYDVTNLHTVGLRAAGHARGFDYEANAAWQFGEADQVGFLFKPYAYGDDGAEYDAWAGDATVGYTFDVAWRPRVYAGGAFFDGEDNRAISFWEWSNPFAAYTRPRASVSFNRLFSNRCYSYFIDEMGELSNFWTARVGVQAKPLEAVELDLSAAYLSAIEPFDAPAHIRWGGWRLPLVSEWSFWTDEGGRELGWETTLRATYRYSGDLVFEAGWSHLFTGAGLEDGVFTDMNGLLYNGGTDGSGADYLYFETQLRF